MRFGIYMLMPFLLPDTRVSTQTNHYDDGKAKMGLPLDTFAPALCVMQI